MANNTLGGPAKNRQAWTHAVRCIVHRWKALPVGWPPFHVLLMTAAEKLDSPQLTLVVELFRKQIFSTVDDSFHHHVGLVALSLRLDDLSALVDGSRRRDRTGHVLASLKCRD